VAEYTLAAILFANKKVFALREFYRRHRENRAPWSREAPNVGNYRKTVGIVGASHVGKLVIERLKSYELSVVLYDPFITPLAARDLGARKLGLSELMAEADVVSLHAPLLKDTYHMIGARELSLMGDGTTLINTARGALVDPRALEAELTKGRIHAVLDTTDPEVLPADSRLFELPNVFLTPHIAGSLGDEAQRLADYMVAEVERFVRGNALKHLVLREHLVRLA
jgi:phosphoglycerate dehydrogenase-like enzyme